MFGLGKTEKAKNLIWSDLASLTQTARKSCWRGGSGGSRKDDPTPPLPYVSFGIKVLPCPSPSRLARWGVSEALSIGARVKGGDFSYGRAMYRLPAPAAGLVSCSATRLFLSPCVPQHGVWLPPRCGRPRGVHVLQRFQNGVRPSHGCRLHDASPPPDDVSLRARDVRLPSCDVRHPYDLPCSILLFNWDCLLGPNIILLIGLLCCGYYLLVFVFSNETFSAGPRMKAAMSISLFAPASIRIKVEDELIPPAGRKAVQ